MKFSLLPIGAKFEYQGECYVKSNPMIASALRGDSQRSIPRSANVVPLEDSAGSGTGEATLKPQHENVNREKVLNAVRQCQDHMRVVITKNVSNNSEQTALKLQLDAAVQELISVVTETAND